MKRECMYECVYLIRVHANKSFSVICMHNNCSFFVSCIWDPGESCCKKYDLGLYIQAAWPKAIVFESQSMRIILSYVRKSSTRLGNKSNTRILWLIGVRHAISFSPRECCARCLHFLQLLSACQPTITLCEESILQIFTEHNFLGKIAKFCIMPIRKSESSWKHIECIYQSTICQFYL